MCRIHTERIRLETGPGMRVHDVTAEVEKAAAASGIVEGTATVFVPGATAGVTTIEHEPGLVRDLAAALERVAPEGAQYAHDARWGDGNGHAHVRASLIGPSLTVPLSGRRLILGTWQQIVFLDFDPPARSREIVVQIMGTTERDSTDSSR